MSFDLSSYLRERKRLFENALPNFLPLQHTDPQKLYESMHYSLFADGKRIRPILTLAVGELLGMPFEDVMPIAASLEMIHVFSLVHDDLPAMDDDDLRRGQPTNHKVFGDAVAILAGDALLAESILPLTKINSSKYKADNILNLIAEIMKATGARGMIGGQVVDLESENRDISLQRLQQLHAMKTGALLKIAVTAPAILAAAPSETLLTLGNYGEAIGLCFQIADDILDIEGGAEIGKDIGSDVEKNKSTYPKLMGLEGAKMEREKTMDRALQCLEGFDDKAMPLRELARYIALRKK